MALNFIGDYHTHSTCSDGKNTVLENALHAQALGLRDIAATEHGMTDVIMTEEKYKKCLKEVIEARKLLPDMNIFFGIENDIVGVDGELDIPLERFDEFQVHLAGFHFPVKLKDAKAFRQLWLPALLSPIYTSKATIRRNTSCYVKLLEKYPVDILVHIGNHTPLDVSEIAKVCSDKGTYIELNCKHIPVCERYMEELLNTDVLFIANTDSHKSESVGDLSAAENLIIKYGIQNRVVNLRKNFFLRSKGGNLITE